MADTDALASREAGDKIIRGGSVRSLGYVAGILAGLVATPLVVRHLGTDEYGRYVTVTSIIFIVAGVTEAGLSNVGVREYVARRGDERQSLLANLAALRLTLALLGLAVAIAFTTIAGYPDVVVAGTALGGLYLVFGVLAHTWMLPLQVDLRIGWISLIDLLRAVTVMAFLLVVVLLDGGLLVLLLAQGAAAAVALVVTVALVRRDVRLRLARQARQWRALVRETGVYAVATAFGIVYFQVAVVATSLLSSERETSFFGVAFRVVDILNGVPWLLVATAFPLLAHAASTDRERLRYALGRMFVVALIAGGWFSLSLIVGAPFAIAVVGGERFEPAVEVLQVVGCAMPFTFLLATWSFALLSLRRHRALLAANATAVTFSIALSLMLIPANGARGAAVVTVATEALLASLYAVALVRSDRRLMPPGRALPPVLLGLGAGLLVGLLPDWHPVLGVLAASASFFAIVIVGGALPAEVREAFSTRRWRVEDGIENPPPPPPAF